jgi:hypothetical protein
MVKLSKTAFGHAKELVNDGKFVWDERDSWSEHQPSTQQENQFLHGIHEYAKRHMGIDVMRKTSRTREDTNSRRRLRKSSPLWSYHGGKQSGAIQHHDIELAAAHLHGMIDEKKPALRSRRARA